MPPAFEKAIQAQGGAESMLVSGLTRDGTTKVNDTAFFATHFPDTPWMTYTHGSMPTKPLKLGLLINPAQGGGHGSGYGWRMPRGISTP